MEILTQKHLFLASVLSAASLQLTIGPWPVATTLLSYHFDIEQAQFFATFCTFSSLIVNIPGTLISERSSLFRLSLGTIPFYIAGELFPQNFRSTGQAIVFFFFYLSGFVFNILILPLYASIGVWCFLPLFIIPQSFCLIILWIFLPETRGREVHEIVGDLKKYWEKSTTKVQLIKCDTSLPDL
ncbi:unnamed protein product [Meloidogyne enterolobii]|uniref:Uncharacterized protein n=1 Tax=Meloidogyne enterolobii TaxID=390850 RepID=A0ACB1A762_MELEN